MATRTDQLHSYQFMLQRVISALIMRETDPAQAPLRRGVGAVFAGVMIAVLVGAGFGVYGIFTGIGSLKWKEDGSIVVEKETGAVYVFRGHSLHPMLNYTSARLASQGGQTYRVNAAELQKIPRSGPAGIPGAPSSLPPSTAKIGAPWTLCSVSGQDATGSQTISTTLTVGRKPAGGIGLGGHGMLVKDATDGSRYLIWHAHRYHIQDSDRLLTSLFGDQTSPVTVGTAWLNGLPAGTDISEIDVPDRGQASSAVSGQSVGDVLVAQTGSGPQYYVVFDDGLAPITPLQKDILAGEFSTEPQHISTSTATDAQRSSQLQQPSDEAVRPPSTVPELYHATSDQSMCTEVSESAGELQVVVGSEVSAMDEGVPTPSRSGSGTAYADRILVPPGRVAIVRSVPSGSSGTGTFNVVTDIGERFPVPSVDALSTLGYSTADAVAMPAGLVHTIPAGPTLDPGAALAPVPPDSDGG